jgi:hypothetical protein
MRIFSSRRRLAVVGAFTAIALAGSGAAFAYFTSTGTGAGAASVGTASNYTVEVSAPTGAALVPGGPGQSFTYTVQNPGTGTQQISAASISVTPDAAAATNGCLAAWYHVSGPGITAPGNAATQTYATPISIPGGTTNSDAQLTFTVTLVNTPLINQDGCENDVPVVSVTVS